MVYWRHLNAKFINVDVIATVLSRTTKVGGKHVFMFDDCVDLWDFLLSSILDAVCVIQIFDIMWKSSTETLPWSQILDIFGTGMGHLRSPRARTRASVLNTLIRTKRLSTTCTEMEHFRARVSFLSQHIETILNENPAISRFELLQKLFQL